MIDSTFVEAISDLVGSRVVTDGNRNYPTKEVFNFPLPIEPQFPTIILHSLNGLADYVAGNRDKASDPKNCMIACESAQVLLVGSPAGEHRKRDLLVVVKANIQQAPVNQWQNLESFRITLLTGYEPTPDRDTILKFISTITDEDIKTSIDDGVSQSATARVGIASLQGVRVPSPVELAPIRTFIEVPQPQSFFIFRMQRGKAGLECGLFEIPSNWQRTAAVSVKEYLGDLAPLQGYTILA